MKVRRLKAKLCRPCGIVSVLKVMVSILCLALPFAAVYALSVIETENAGRTEVEVNLILPIALLMMLVISALIILGGTLFSSVIFGVGSVRELRVNGRMSYEYLERTGMLEAAAEEYFGKDRFKCRLKRKGWKHHRFAHRKNVLTPNFIFIMSDNVVLTYDEVKKARFLRMEIEKKGRLNYSDTFSLQMADGTEIALFSSVFIFEYADLQKEVSRRKAAVDEVTERILAKNPDCEISGDIEKTKTVCFDDFKPYYR